MTRPLSSHERKERITMTIVEVVVIAAGGSGGIGNRGLMLYTTFGGLYFATGATVHIVRIVKNAVTGNGDKARAELQRIEDEYRLLHLEEEELHLEEEIVRQERRDDDA
jgi:hypothetical protein